MFENLQVFISFWELKYKRSSLFSFFYITHNTKKETNGVHVATHEILIFVYYSSSFKLYHLWLLSEFNVSYLGFSRIKFHSNCFPHYFKHVCSGQTGFLPEFRSKASGTSVHTLISAFSHVPFVDTNRKSISTQLHSAAAVIIYISSLHLLIKLTIWWTLPQPALILHNSPACLDSISPWV